MKNENEINEILKNHERRMVALETLIGNSKKLKIKKNKQSLSDYIIELRDNNFFSQPRIAEETHAKLRDKYHCEVNRVTTALLRIAERQQLRKASKTVSGKKYKAYVW